MAFPDSWMRELMNRNDIVSVISEYTRLNAKGGRMWGLCPFHPERDASFSVSPDKQLFHCFSCKAGGSVIQFIMQAENLSYVEAVRHLAQRAGMDMPNEVDDARLREDKARRDRLYKANREAALFYHKTLLSDTGKAARNYLISRGIDANTAVRFGLGYAPNDWNALYNYMTALGYQRDDLLDAGLCIKSRKNEDMTFDFFHDRLMFPVIAANGRVIAFGGRILAGDGAKYMNTGDTLIYNKRHNIYGINMMKGRKLSELIMVEGYMDVISLHQAGVDNAVASLGTALTNQQARLLKRFAPGVYYAYDGDSAGQKAMLRGIEILKNNDIEPKVIKIPEGKDPDEFVRTYGTEAFLLLRDSAMTAPMFRLEYMANGVDFSTPDGRERYAKETCEFISELEPVERERYLKVVSERTGMSMDVLRRQCGESKQNSGEVGQRTITGTYRRQNEYSERARAEQLLLSCLMTNRMDAQQIIALKNFSMDLFKQPGVKTFAESLKAAYTKTDKPDITALIAECEGKEGEIAGAAASSAGEISSPVAMARDCIDTILKMDYDDRIRELAILIETETSSERRLTLQREQLELVVKSRSIR